MGFPGEIFAVLAAVFFAASGVAVAKGAGHRSGDNGALLSVVITALSAAAIWIPTASLERLPNSSGTLLTGAGWFALSGVLTIFIGRLLFYKSIAFIGAIRTSTLLRLNPLFSVLLAALVLGEAINGVAGAGMILIGLSFVILLRRSLAAFITGKGAPQPAAEPGPVLSYYLIAPTSAFSYAVGNIARKHALNIIPDSNLGTLISAVAGLLSFSTAAVFIPQYRAAFWGVFRNANRWQVWAGILTSAGQLCQFAAIHHIGVSRAIMIASSEVLFSMFFAVYVLKTERRPDVLTLLAALVAMTGVVMVASG